MYRPNQAYFNDTTPTYYNSGVSYDTPHLVSPTGNYNVGIGGYGYNPYQTYENNIYGYYGGHNDSYSVGPRDVLMGYGYGQQPTQPINQQPYNPYTGNSYYGMYGNYYAQQQEYNRQREAWEQNQRVCKANFQAYINYASGAGETDPNEVLKQMQNNNYTNPNYSSLDEYELQRRENEYKLEMYARMERDPRNNPNYISPIVNYTYYDINRKIEKYGYDLSDDAYDSLDKLNKEYIDMKLRNSARERRNLSNRYDKSKFTDLTVQCGNDISYSTLMNSVDISDIEIEPPAWISSENAKNARRSFVESILANSKGVRL